MSMKPMIVKQQIMDRAYELACSDGLDAVTIRNVAQGCGISVGSIYNYYPTKDELLLDVIGQFFGKAFYENFCHPDITETYVRFCRRLFASMHDTLNHFRAEWLEDISRLSLQTRQQGKIREYDRLDHIEKGLVMVFENDTTINRAVLTEDFNAETISAFVLDNLMSALRLRHDDCGTLFVFLEKTLYR
jgi:AcrR family transcriptional regulator